MNKKFLAFWALCGVILLDGVGLGIIFPLLVPLFWDPSHGIFAQGVSASTRNLWYGITLSVFPLGLFFAAPILGDLSDGFGRKKILILAVLGVGTAYFLTAVAIIWRSLPLLVFSRLMAGLLSGCQPIAQAAVMDISTPEEKSKSLSLIFLFSSAGFIIGPLLGGSLSDSHVVRWFDLSTPMLAAAFFSFACSFLLLNFQETLLKTREVMVQPLRGFRVLKEVWEEKSIRILLLVLLLYQLSWSAFFQVLPAFAAKQYGLNTQEIGYLSSFTGLGFGIAFSGCINYLEKRFKAPKVVVACFFAANLCLLLILVCHKMTAVWIIATPLGFCMATVYVLITTMGSNSVPETHQGWFMGAIMSLLALAWFVTPLINAALLAWFLFAPIVFSFILLLVAFILYSASHLVLDKEQVSESRECT